MILKNFSQPLGTQSLRLWQRLRALRRGALAVPSAKNHGGGPALPLRRNAQVLLKASAIRAFKAREILLVGGIFPVELLCQTTERPSPRAESDSSSLEILRAGVGKPTARHAFWRERWKDLPTSARVDFSRRIRLRPGRWASGCLSPFTLHDL